MYWINVSLCNGLPNRVTSSLFNLHGNFYFVIKFLDISVNGPGNPWCWLFWCIVQIENHCLSKNRFLHEDYVQVLTLNVHAIFFLSTNHTSYQQLKDLILFLSTKVIYFYIIAKLPRFFPFSLPENKNVFLQILTIKTHLKTRM